MKLTKTEQAILEELKTAYMGRVSVTICRNHGARRHDAMIKLRDKGFLRLVHRYRETETHQGWSKHYSISIWERDPQNDPTLLVNILGKE